MIDHPHLSFHDLTEDELTQKSQDLHRNLSKASMWGSSRDIIDQLQWMLEMVEEERMERMKRASFEAMQSMFPERVESDPEFSQQKSDLQDTKTTVVKPASKSRPTGQPDPVFHKEYTKDRDKK